jgi:hypothetical protein
VIKQGTALAKIAAVQEGEICETRLLNVEPGKVDPMVPHGAAASVVPQYLEDLLNRSTEGMNEEDTRRVERLLIQYQGVFSSGEFDIGRTTWVKHSIDTGGAAPIRQPLRRSSPTQRAEVERQVEELLAKGLIQPSDSPWSSPVVLVDKKDGSKRLCLDYRRLNDVAQGRIPFAAD